MPIPQWTKFAAIALLAGSALAWSTGPSAAQPFPSRTVVLDGYTGQVENVGHRRSHRRAHRRHHYRSHHRHHGFHFSVAVPHVVPAPVYVAPPPPPVVMPSGCGPAVTVRPGDTLAVIAARCGTSMGALMSANPQIYNPNVIHVGQVIRMPWG